MDNLARWQGEWCLWFGNILQPTVLTYIENTLCEQSN